MKIKELKYKCQLKRIYNKNLLTIEGCQLIEDNYDFIQNWLLSIKSLIAPISFIYDIKGKTMNRIYKLKGDMKYPNDLDIICVDNQFYNESKIGSQRFDIGARWFKDITDCYKNLQID